MQFKNYEHKEKVPFIVYADFECILVPVNSPPANTQVVQRHEPFSVGYYVHCSYDTRLCRYEAYCGPNHAKWFADRLVELSRSIAGIYANKKDMDLTPEETVAFEAATQCHICGKDFQLGEKRVRDHCHLTGKSITS